MNITTIDQTPLKVQIQLVQAQLDAQHLQELRQLRVEKCQLLMTLQALGKPIIKSRALDW